MADKFGGQVGGLESPAMDVFQITPDDDNDLAVATRAIRVTVGGDVKLVTVGGQTVVCAFASGETRAIRAVRVLDTDTTATGIEGMA